MERYAIQTQIEYLTRKMCIVARSNVYGKCALCRKHRKLCKSHYLGRILHTLSREERGHPVVMTPKLITITSKQLWAHLLCSSCEQLLNEKGEKPVQALFNGVNGFPLLNRMELALPFKVAPTVITYSGLSMGIDTEPLAYYALSMLWKGAVHKWTTLKGQKSYIKIGKHRERIRRHQVGGDGLPLSLSPSRSHPKSERRERVLRCLRQPRLYSWLRGQTRPTVIWLCSGIVVVGT